MLPKYIAIVLLCACSYTSSAQNYEVLQAQLDNDVEKLIKLCNSNNSFIRREAEKAILTSSSDLFFGIDYNTASKYYAQIKYNENIGPLFKDYLERQKQTEMSSLQNKTIEELKQYSRSSNFKKDLLSEVLDNTIYSNMSELSFNELNYIVFSLSDYHNSDFLRERGSRSAEIQSILKDNVDRYIAEESLYFKNFKYVVEYSAYQYLYDCYQQIINEYAQIGEVPGNIPEMESQYRSIVNQVISDSKYKNYLQDQLNLFCDNINQCRLQYAKTAGKDNFVKLKLTLPAITLVNNDFYSDNLKTIAEEKEAYKNNRELADYAGTAIGAIGTVVGFFSGGLAGFVGNALGAGVKHAANAYLTSDMVENVSNARKDYVLEVLSLLENSIESECDRIENELNVKFTNNQKEFSYEIKN